MPHRLVQGKLPKSSSFRHTSLAHALDRAFASCEVDRILARCAGAETTDGEGRIERQRPPRSGSGLVQLAALRQSGCKIELPGGIISVELDAAPQPCDRLLISSEMELGHAGKKRPGIGSRFPRREAERLLNMRFSLLGVTKSNLREADMSVSAGQISIQGERQLAFVKALGGAFQWVQIPPGNRSSPKQPEQLWR